jgi:predicted TIM-barrel fold metal-dependent hydrolase
MIVDFHTHILPDRFEQNREKYLTMDTSFAELYSAPKSKIVTAENLINSMNINGVDISVVMGIGWSNIDMAMEANDYIIESVQRYPTRLVGFFSVNPAWGESALKEMER